MATGDIPKDYKAELTTPTQAQIEAAVWEVLTEWRAEMHDNVKHSLARRIAERIGHFIDRPTTALTAAIGVPDQEHILQKPVQKPGLLPNGNAAVGEIPLTERERLDEHYNAAMAMNEKHRRLWVEECQKRPELIAATIERCAQVAEEFWVGDYEFSKTEIAAEIRALKDKP